MVWYLDEVFFGLDCSLSYTWMVTNIRMAIKTNGERFKDCVIGTVCPENGQTFFLQIDWMDSFVVSVFLRSYQRITLKKSILSLLIMLYTIKVKAVRITRFLKIS